MAIFDSDVLTGPVWLGVTLLMLRAAWLCSRRLFPRDDLLQTILHTTALFWATIVGAGLALGATGLLYPLALLAVGAAVAVLALRWADRPRNCGVARHDLGASETQVEGQRPETAWLFVWGAVLAFWLAHVFFNGLLAYPTDWDSLTYHIPLVDQWLRARGLYAPACAYWYNPGNNEVLGLWLVAPFSGDFLVGLNNLPVAILLAAGAVELGRGVGLGTAGRHAAGLAVVSTWPLLRQLVDAENDLAVAGLFLAALAYGIRFARGHSTADLALASVCVGLLAGVKYYALGYAAVAGAFVTGLALGCHGRRAGARAAVFVVVGLLLWGGYWYVRNLLVTGSPIFPKGFSPETDLWREMRPGSATSSFLGSGRPEVWPLALEALWRMTGPCHLGAVLAVPASLGWLLVSGLTRLRGEVTRVDGAVRLGLALAVAASALVFLSTPNAVEMVPGSMDMLKRKYLPVRFGLSFLSVAVVGLAVFLSDAARGIGHLAGRGAAGAAGYALGTLSAVLVAYQFGRLVQENLRRDLFDKALLSFNFFALGGIAWAVSPQFRRRLAPAAAVVALAGVAWAAGHLSTRWHRDFAQFYERRFQMPLSTLSEGGAEETSVCVCGYRYYPFLGSRRQFRVCRPTWLRDYPSLLRYLDANEVTLVVVVNDDHTPQGRYKNVKAWLDAHPEVFGQVGRNNEFASYRVRRPSARELSSQGEGRGRPTPQGRAR